MISSSSSNTNLKVNECPTKPGPSTPSSSPSSFSSGRIRLFSPEGDRSALATISVDTTSADLAKAYEVDTIYLQIGNLHIRPLAPSARPLMILREFLLSLGHSESTARAHGTGLRFRHLIAFFLGRPELQPNSIARSEILVAHCDVRRGKLMHRWSRHKCIFHNGTLRIQKDGGEDDVLQLSRCRVDICESRRGTCLRIIQAASVTSVFLLHFDEPEELALWSTRCRQSGQRHSYDLSDSRLTLLPESLLGSDPREVQQLNLRRNSLSFRQSCGPPSVQLGCLDDLNRLTSLTCLDLSSNRLPVFPTSIIQLTNLQKLNLSSNCIQTIPAGIRNLKRLSSFNLENNWVSLLPSQMVECDQLQEVDLRFNRIKEIPEDVLIQLVHIKEWSLAGNYVECVSTDGPLHIEKLDLRRNSLCGCFRLPSGCFDQLTFLDIRDNCSVSTVHLTNIPSLQVVHCERLQLTSLHLNGQSLTHLHAQHNMLDCLIVMPIPLHLVFIDISYNNFDVLPDWIGDLPQIDCLRVNNNRLTCLPERLFHTSSLRYLFCKNNLIKALPQPVKNSSLISCVLYNNLLNELPAEFLLKCNRLRHLNVSFNRLENLPPVNPNPDHNRIITLRLRSNALNETIVPKLMKMKQLKVLDLSHNKLRYFDDSALNSLYLLEELNLSSNELTTLSVSIFNLPALQILKVHSNRIKLVPDLSTSPSLQVVDMSNNLIGVLDSPIASGLALNQLDLTCNSALSLKSGTLRLCIRRVHCGNVFGMIDGSFNYDLPKTAQTILKRIISNYDHLNIGSLSSVLLRAHESLAEAGERLGCSCLLAHIAPDVLAISYVGNIAAAVMSSGHLEKITESVEIDDEQYDRIRSAGGTVDESNMVNGVSSSPHQLGFYSLHPVIHPKPINKSIAITSKMDYVIIASWAIWEYLSNVQLATILASSINPQVAAKMIQDSLQACDYNGNACVVVIRLQKPELAFRSEALPSEPAHPLSSLTVPPMKAEKVEDLQKTTLQKIEQRLERISEVIAKMDDEATNVQGISPTTRRHHSEEILAEDKVSNWMLSPSSSTAPPPPDPINKHTQLVDEFKSKIGNVGNFKPHALLASATGVGVVATTCLRLNTQHNGCEIFEKQGDAEDPGDSTSISRGSFPNAADNNNPDPHQSDNVYNKRQASRAVHHRRETALGEETYRCGCKTHQRTTPYCDDAFCITPEQRPYSFVNEENHSNLGCDVGNINQQRQDCYLTTGPIITRELDTDAKTISTVQKKVYCYPTMSLLHDACNANRSTSWKSDASLKTASFGSEGTDKHLVISTFNSGVYNIREATKHRHRAEYEPVSFSFDYYSHTKVRPYKGINISYDSVHAAPSFKATPAFEYAAPYKNKMSAIDEAPEQMQRSTNEEQEPSVSPPPLPVSFLPKHCHISSSPESGLKQWI